MHLKKGFTLSEVMVTLALVGIIAGVLTPAFMQMAPSNNKVMIKKEYNVLAKAISDMANDELSYPASKTTGTIRVDGLMGAPSPMTFNYTTVVTSGTNDPWMNIPSTVSSTQKFCYLLQQELNLVSQPVCPSYGLIGNASDGSMWYLIQGNFPIDATDYTTRIIVDVNGAKAPNCSADPYFSTYKYGLTGTGVPTYSACTSNADTFFVSVNYSGRIRLGGFKPSDPYVTSILSDQTNNTN